MDNVVNKTLVYEIADAFQMQVEARPAAPRLSGKVSRDIDLAGAKVTIDSEIVSSLINPRNHMAIVRVKGNLAMLLVTEDKLSTMLVLNVAKLPAISRWLELHQPNTVTAAEKLLGKAVVKKFTRTNGAWQPA